VITFKILYSDLLDIVFIFLCLKKLLLKNWVPKLVYILYFINNNEYNNLYFIGNQ